MRSLLAIVLLFGLSDEWTADRKQVTYVNVTGDIVLGGLFPIHRRGSGGESCGEIQVRYARDSLESIKVNSVVGWLVRWRTEFSR